jgi:hypothetical protein
MNLTFLTEPMKYQPEAHELCSFIPAGITSTEELADRLEEDLGRPDYRVMNWAQTLRDVLRFWDDWEVTPQRVILLHQDLPLLHESKDGWYLLQIYLEVLLDCMDFLQGKNATQTDPSQQRELVVIFPSHLYKEVHAVLYHPPTWDITIGFPDYPISGERDVTWPVILRYLHMLNGLTAHVCTLSREDVGDMDVYYQRESDTYFIEYHQAGQNRWDGKFGSIEEEPSISSGLSFALIVSLLETFFTHGEPDSSVYWLDLSRVSLDDLDVRHGEPSYRNEEEGPLEIYIDTIRETIQNGIRESVNEDGEKAFSLEYWSDVLTQKKSSLSRNLTALCLIGISGLREAPALLRPFLQSKEKRERWMSARFSGRWHEEAALPVLLNMLTDELPIKHDDGRVYDPWYEEWRADVPHLLRFWQTAEVQNRLHQALTIWVQLEPLFDPEYDLWKWCELEICYELGYREDLTALTGLELEEEHRDELLTAMKRGYKVRRERMTPREEYAYLKRKNL